MNAHQRRIAARRFEREHGLAKVSFGELQVPPATEQAAEPPEVLFYEQTAFSRLIGEARLRQRVPIAQLAISLRMTKLAVGDLLRSATPRLGPEHWTPLASLLGLTIEQLRAAYDDSPEEAVPLPPPNASAAQPLTEEDFANPCDYCGEWDLIGSGHLAGEPCPEAT